MQVSSHLVGHAAAWLATVCGLLCSSPIAILVTALRLLLEPRKNGHHIRLLVQTLPMQLAYFYLTRHSAARMKGVPVLLNALPCASRLLVVQRTAGCPL